MLSNPDNGCPKLCDVAVCLQLSGLLLVASLLQYKAHFRPCLGKAGGMRRDAVRQLFALLTLLATIV